jgi:hypothetical protein
MKKCNPLPTSLMFYKINLLFYIILFAAPCFSQSYCGYVRDKETGERLTGVNIRELSTGRGSSTDERGFFCLPQSKGSWIFSMIGYKSDTLNSNDNQLSQNVNINLEASAFELGTVEVVQSFSHKNFLQGLSRINASELARIPALAGEKDLIKSLTIMPGIQSGAEGFSGISVRGGGTDHNLFILDGTPIHNTGHLFNFVSVFNQDAIKDVAIYKNGFPARYGGRLASVVEVNLKDGNYKERKISADLGLINSKFSIEGPLSDKGKSSYMFAARSTYLDVFKNRKLKHLENLPLGTFARDQDSEFGYTFSDMNLKYNYRFNDANWLFVSIYSGIDYYRIRDAFYDSRRTFNMTQTNHLASIKTHHMLSDKLFLEAIISTNEHGQLLTEKELFYSVHHTFDPETFISNQFFNLESGFNQKANNKLKGFSSEVHGTYNLKGEGLIKGGVSILRHHYTLPAYYRLLSDSLGIIQEYDLKNPELRANEGATYVSLEIPVFQSFHLMTGLRISAFQTTSGLQANPEPRISLGYNIPDKGVINLAYSIMQQYEHALIKNEQLMQNTIWVPSSKNLKAQEAEQYSVGYMRVTTDYQFEANVYYKKLDNLVYFNIPNNNTFTFYDWQDNIIGGGIGRGYGSEISVTKTRGNVTGNINYAFSQHKRKFEQVNRGAWFPFKYNREHVLNVFATKKISPLWSMGAFWTLSSGARSNFPNGHVQSNPFTWGYYSYPGLNNMKLPTYHRLDLSFDWAKTLKNQHTLGVSFNIYNAYYRKNSNLVFLVNREVLDENGIPTGEYYRLVKSKSFMPVLPAVNISYKM